MRTVYIVSFCRTKSMQHANNTGARDVTGRQHAMKPTHNDSFTHIFFNICCYYDFHFFDVSLQQFIRMKDWQKNSIYTYNRTRP